MVFIKYVFSAIAELAGVERLTVYRHFPDERSLATACVGHYQATNPPPDPGSWQNIEDAEQRLRKALHEIYAYHRRTEQMSIHALRDIEEVLVLREVLAPIGSRSGICWPRYGEPRTPHIQDGFVLLLGMPSAFKRGAHLCASKGWRMRKPLN